MAGADRVFEVMDTEPDIKDSPEAKDIAGSRGEITFENVSFNYIDSMPVLRISVSRQSRRGWQLLDLPEWARRPL